VLSGEFQNGDSVLVTMTPEGEVTLERSPAPETEKEVAPVV
jgi:hypothetical protein